MLTGLLWRDGTGENHGLKKDAASFLEKQHPFRSFHGEKHIPDEALRLYRPDG